MIPLAVRRGTYVLTSTLDGTSANGYLDSEPAAQVQRAFLKLPEALASVGARPESLVSIAISVEDEQIVPHVDALWRAFFGEGGAPARRITRMTLPPGHFANVAAVAVAGANRAAVAPLPGMPPGLAPAGARAGALFVSSAVEGRRADGTFPADAGDEIAQAFDNACALVAAAGGTPDDIVHFWAFAAPGIVASDFTPSWLARFPHDGRRPARKTFLGAPLAGPARVTLQATACIGGGERANFEVPWVRHKDPLPMAARVGDLFMSSGLLPNVPDPDAPNGMGPIPPSLGEQLDQSFASLEALLAAQGAALASVAHFGAVLLDEADLPAVRAAIVARFAADRVPALQWWSLPLASPLQVVQLFATAVV